MIYICAVCSNTALISYRQQSSQIQMLQLFPPIAGEIDERVGGHSCARSEADVRQIHAFLAKIAHTVGRHAEAAVELERAQAVPVEIDQALYRCVCDLLSTVKLKKECEHN